MRYCHLIMPVCTVRSTDDEMLGMLIVVVVNQVWSVYYG